MTAPIRIPTPTPYELYRVVLDYEALQDGFLDRIEDLNTSMTEIDAAAGFTTGHTQKLLHKGGTNKWARRFAGESLGKMLKGTGLVIALILDEERFGPLKTQLAPRKRIVKHEMLPAGSMKLVKGKITPKTSIKMQVLRTQKLTARQRSVIAKRAARIRWKRSRATIVPEESERG